MTVTHERRMSYARPTDTVVSGICPANAAYGGDGA
ncbi:hypothetical protein Theco_2384 [Thermobacillus composti KWC4]|uniref:Uncharacterized protein n=1 Tax=Thermobacillus composti (strain DSM 18247 / JCM 13945 / KWC4) TaxID=717605 RepID=L0EFA8_THECK|nr:hypothetical protein Theco_2384 [Thermobacillus composti KWC4]